MRLAELTPVLKDAEWTVESLEQVVKRFCEERELKLGKIAQPLRAALTGTSTSPGIFDVLYALGREESIGRLDDAAVVNKA